MFLDGDSSHLLQEIAHRATEWAGNKIQMLSKNMRHLSTKEFRQKPFSFRFINAKASSFCKYFYMIVQLLSCENFECQFYLTSTRPGLGLSCYLDFFNCERLKVAKVATLF